MTSPKYDPDKLKKALDKFGSLEAAIEALESKKADLEVHNEKLKQKSTELQVNVDDLSKKAELKSKELQEGQRQLQVLSDKIKEHEYQYKLFEGFLAMLAGSPSTKSSLEKLIATLQKLADSWKVTQCPDELRSIFVRQVMGDFLRCYRCDSCGARFIVNREPSKELYKTYYVCPACHYSHAVTEDDSFLKAMVSKEQIENVHRLEQVLEENEALKPLKVFLKLPCEVCGEPINKWTKNIIEKGVTQHCWGHTECWQSDKGQIKQMMKLAEEELKERLDSGQWQ
jgi:hypothetical protein